jgi:trimethylguanosine synthase
LFSDWSSLLRTRLQIPHHQGFPSQTDNESLCNYPRFKMSADDQDIADAIEQQIARDILGPWVDAPTAQLLLPQARQIPPAAWEIIKRVLETNSEARDDVTCLTKLLASESQAAIDAADANEAADVTEDGGITEDAKPSGFSLEPAGRLPLTDECHHYTGKHEVPWDIQK